MKSIRNVKEMSLMERKWWMSRWINLFGVAINSASATYNFMMHRWGWMTVGIVTVLICSAVILHIGHRERKEYEQHVLEAI